MALKAADNSNVILYETEPVLATSVGRRVGCCTIDACRDWKIGHAVVRRTEEKKWNVTESQARIVKITSKVFGDQSAAAHHCREVDLDPIEEVLEYVVALSSHRACASYRARHHTPTAQEPDSTVIIRIDHANIGMGANNFELACKLVPTMPHVVPFAEGDICTACGQRYAPQIFVHPNIFMSSNN